MGLYSFNEMRGGEMMRVKNLLGILVVIAMLSAPAALAAVTFHEATNSIDLTNGKLSVDFFVSGLGSKIATAPVSLSADGTAVYQCWNNGGKHPQAGNKETVSGPVTASGNFSVRNGQVTGTIEAGPPGPGSFSCPSGQSLFLESVSYSNTFLTVAGVTEQSLPDPINSGPTPLHIKV